MKIVPDRAKTHLLSRTCRAGLGTRSTTLSPTRRELVRATRARILEAAARLARERGPGRVQHGPAGQGGRRRPRHGLRALPLEARGARRAGGDRGALGHARSRRTRPTATRCERCATRSAEVCRHWAEHEETMRELRTLAAVTGGEADRRRDRSGRRCASSSTRSPRGGHLRGALVGRRRRRRARGAHVVSRPTSGCAHSERTPEQVEGAARQARDLDRRARRRARRAQPGVTFDARPPSGG